MSDYVLAAKAKQDINSIYKYTSEKWSIGQADRYFKGLQRTMERISIYPEAGKQYKIISPHYYGFKFKSHIIFYLILDSNKVKIIRILHEKMDIPTILNP